MIDRFFGRAAFVAAALLAITACGGNVVPSDPNASGPGAARKLNVRFTIRIPRTSHRRHRGTHFISPSTQSIAISIATNPGGVTAAKINANLTPASGGCTTTNNATVCQKSVTLAPGTYAATVNTYDQQNEGGNVLSQGQSLPVTVTAGKSNSISLVLGGVPHSVSITAGALGIQGSQNAGFTLFGSRPLAFTITAKDADDNTIVGKQSLSYTASITSGSGWRVQATPQPKTPNTFMLTPPGSDGSTAAVKLTFNYGSNACGQAGALCTVSFDAKNHVQILAVTDCETSCGGTGVDTVMLFKASPPIYGSSSSSGYAPFATISKGVVNPVAVAIDKAGTLFVANCQASCGVPGSAADTVTVYQPPFTGSPSPAETITTGISYPTLLAFNSSGDLFVNNCMSCSDTSSSSFQDVVTVYSHTNYTGAPTTVSSTGVVAGMAVDPSDNLLIAACRASCAITGADAILQYAPSYSGTATVITNGVGLTGTNGGGLASDFAFDASRNLWSLNCNGCSGVSPSYTATHYTAPFSDGGNPDKTITGTLPLLSVALDSSGNLFTGAGDGTNNYVWEYAAPAFSGGGSKLFGGAAYQAYEMAVDGFDDLIVSDESSVQVSVPPYTGMTQIAPYSSPNGGQVFALSP